MLINKYIFSIIIPHHNIPDLLVRCLNSIPRRDDIQIIVVDDKSDELYNKDLQIISNQFPYTEFIFLKQNKGGGYARNVGIKHAKGKYLLFADADDYFTYGLSAVLDDYLLSDVDVIYFDAISQDSDTYKISSRARHLNRMIRRYPKNTKDSERNLRYVFGEPWSKMVKRSIIEEYSIKFDEYNIHNDTKFSYLVGFYCKKMIVDQRAIYCVTTRLGSVSKVISLDRLLTRTRVFGEANQFYKAHQINYFEERALRPLIYFLYKGKLREYKMCISILKSCGMSSWELFFRQIIYPYLLTKKLMTKYSW